MWTPIRALFIIGTIVTVVGYASSFSLNGGDAQGQASIGTGAVAVEGCNANVEVDVNGGDSQDNAIFDEDARDFVIQSISVDASRSESGKSDCADHQGKVWMQLMSGDDAYGSVLGPVPLNRGKAHFGNIADEHLLAGRISDVHIMIEILE